MLDERGARSAVAGHDVHDARRQLGLGADLREQQRGKRRGLGGFQHDRVSAGQGRGDFPGCDQERKIPGHDRTDHTERARVLAAQYRPR